MNKEDTEQEDSLKDASLQDIIMKRKAHVKLKAEQKRQADLKRIRAMKSTSGIDPLEQFPKEIWEEIFNSLNPESRGSARQVHPLFSHLMETSQIRDIFLPQVLQLDAFHRCFKQPNSFHIANYEFTKHLRCLSKISREYFDDWIDLRFEKQMQEPDAYNFAFYNHLGFEFCKFVDHLLLPKLIKAYGKGKNRAKRFLARGISVHFTEQNFDFSMPEDEEHAQNILTEVRRIFKKNVETVLDLIGDQIWHFRFFITDEEGTPFSFTEIYRLFQRLVLLLPNLKWLEFCVQGMEEPYPASGISDNLNFLRENPFPHIASLERVTIRYDDHFPDSCQNEILDAVINANPQIKVLDAVDGENSEIRNLPFHEIKTLTNLTNFTVTHCNFPGHSLLLIMRMVNFNWPLKFIYLNLDMDSTMMGFLFRFLEKFPTLETVNLNQLKRPRIMETDKLGYLKLPNLRDFHLAVGCPVIDYDSNIHFFFSLQFLLRCAKLKTFTWLMYEFDDAKLRKHLKEREEPGKTIDFRAGLRVLYDSNIWDVFPSLKSCKVNVRKSGHQTENVHLYRTAFCKHEYLRPGPGERLTITQFLKTHNCCRSEHGLYNCVALVE